MIKTIRQYYYIRIGILNIVPMTYKKYLSLIYNANFSSQGCINRDF